MTTLPRTKYPAIALALLACTLAAILGSAAPAWAAATVLPADDEMYIPRDEARLSMYYGNAEIETSSQATVRKSESQDYYMILLEKPQGTTEISYFYDVCTITFRNAATIGRRSVDVTAHMNTVEIYPTYNNRTDYSDETYFAIARLTTDESSDSGFTIGNYITDSDAVRYRSQISVDMTFTVTWSDTGQTVDLPFFCANCDLDVPVTSSAIYDPTGMAGFAEAWEPITGFDGVSYVFPSSTVLQSDGRFIAQDTTQQEDADSWYRGGVISGTNTGTWRCKYYSGWGWLYVLAYSSYIGLTDPVKTVDASTCYHEGDEVTYTVTQRVGTWQADVYNTYTSYEFEDVIPEGLRFSHMEVSDSLGNNLTGFGLSGYDADTRKASFAFENAWFEDPSQYQGQDIIWTITCVVEKPDQAIKTLSNTATSIITGLYYDSNAADITVHDAARVTVTKKVLAADVNEAQGTPSFMFKLSSEDATYYRMVTVDASAQPDASGYLSATCVFDGIPEDSYTLEEIGTARFEAADIQTDGTIEDDCVVIDLRELVQSSTTISDKKATDTAFSDSASATNHFSCSTPAEPEPAKSGDAYAILYEDGTLVFQAGDIADSLQNASTYHAFPVSLYSEYDTYKDVPWYRLHTSVTSAKFDSSFASFKPTCTSRWMYGCLNMAEVDGMSNLDMSHVTTANRMFCGCHSLTSIDVSSWDTSNLESLFGIFNNCPNLISLDLSTWDTGNVTTTSYAFAGCTSLKRIYASSLFNMGSVDTSSMMFSNCTSLQGQAGTAYSSDHVDAEYARIDKAGTPGYFSAKAA